MASHPVPDAGAAAAHTSDAWHDTWARLERAENDLDLLRLSGDVDEELLDASLDGYQHYLDQLDAARSHLDALLADTAATLDELAEMSAAFRAIDGQTQAFQAQSAAILDEHKKNEAIARDIADNLRYYEPLERITRRLNAPGAGAFVRSKDFSEMLVTLDECIDYMQTHPTHKEAESYRSRYKILLTRALTLVRNAFMSSVRETTTDVAARVAAKQLNETTQSALLYAKFRVAAADMKELGLEIQKRAAPPADADPTTEGEYQALMNELHTAFAACRARLILPIVRAHLAEIAQTPSSADLVSFSRAAISYVRGICLDEFELWTEYFHGYRGVYDFLESLLLEPLYDHLRPRIIHENKLSKLCALVSLLQTRYLRDEDDDTPQDLTQLDFAALIQPALEDAQTRLVFRAQSMLRDEIENFKPTPADLEYPRALSTSNPKSPGATVLSGRRSSRDLPEDDSDSDPDRAATRFHPSNRALQSAYPTLPRAIRLLSRIYRLLNASVFDDLAHAIVHTTTLSLVNASVLISQKSSPADGQLFLLRHLLLLKSRIIAFDIEFVTPDVALDFSSVSATFLELRSRGELFSPASWLSLIRSGGLLPRVVENMLDAKVELDGRLRTVINDFTRGFADAMTADLPQPAGGAASDSLKKPNKLAGASAKVEDQVAATRTCLVREVPVLRAKLEQYIDDARTRETLVAAVEDLVVQAYEAFFDTWISSRGSGNGAAATNGGGKISRKGKGKEDGVWDSDTFAEWVEGVFNVALPGEEDESGAASRSLSRAGSM